MVFPSWDRAPDPVSDEISLPSVQDRLLAFLIDCLIFFPIIGLLVAMEVKHLKILTLLDSQSELTAKAGLLLLFEVMILAVGLEALFVRFQGATPGQRFLQMRVVSWPDGRPVDFLQAAQRALLWWVGLLTLLPLLSIYTNSLRRAFHDRATDTLLRSDLRQGDTGPHPGEKSLFRSWARMVFLMYLMVSVGAILEVRERVRRPDYLQELARMEKASCPVLEGETDILRRLDLGITLYRLGGLTEDCLSRESDTAAWSSDPEIQVAAFLAKSHLSSEHSAQAYREKVCEMSADSEACAVTRFIKSDESDKGNLLRRKGLAMLSTRLHLLEDSIARGEFVSAAALLEDISRRESLRPYLDRLAIRTLWGMTQEVKAERGPAAASEWEKIVGRLKKRLDLP